MTEHPDQTEERRIQRWQSGSHLLNTALMSILLEGGWRKPAHKRAFLASTSWSAMIRIQDAERFLRLRIYTHNGRLVDDHGRPYVMNDFVPTSNYDLVPFTSVKGNM